MDDLDTILSRMKALPLDPRVNAIDDAVLAGLAQHTHSHVSLRAMALVAMISLGVGLAGSLVPAGPVHAATVFPLGTPGALAPSTLLGTGE